MSKFAAGINEQITQMYVRDGLTAEQIAESLELDLMAVLAVLAQTREAANKKDENGRCVKKDLEQHRDAFVATLGELATYAENEQVKLKAATVGLEFLHGQRDPRKVAPPVSATQIHIVIKQAAERAKQIKEYAKQNQLAPVKVVDV